MSIKNNSYLAKKISQLIQPAIFIVLLIVVWQTFSTNRSEEILKEQLDKTEQNLSIASNSLHNSKNSIDSLNNKIAFFEEKSKILSLERDSLLLKFQRETAANWASLQKIITRQKEVNSELKYLRNKNKDFE